MAREASERKQQQVELMLSTGGADAQALDELEADVRRIEALRLERERSEVENRILRNRIDQLEQSRAAQTDEAAAAARETISLIRQKLGQQGLAEDAVEAVDTMNMQPEHLPPEPDYTPEYLVSLERERQRTNANRPVIIQASGTSAAIGLAHDAMATVQEQAKAGAYRVRDTVFASTAWSSRAWSGNRAVRTIPPQSSSAAAKQPEAPRAPVNNAKDARRAGGVVLQPPNAQRYVFEDGHVETRSARMPMHMYDASPTSH